MSLTSMQSERLERLRSRLKDVLWGIREQYGHKPQLDRVLPYLVFGQTRTDVEFQDLFIGFPARVPARFGPALLIEIQRALQYYRVFKQTHKQYHRAFQQIVRLEGLFRVGPKGCEFIPNDLVGYTLKVKGRQASV